MQSFNYNTLDDLWHAESAGQKQDNRKLTIADGHVYRGRDCIARFTDDQHAIDTLTRCDCKFTVQNPHP